MEREEVEQFVDKLIKEVWHEHSIDKLDQFYHRDLEGHYNEDFIDFTTLEKKVKIFEEHMKNLQIEVVDLIVDDQSFALRANQTIRATDMDLSIATIFMAHLKDGKISKYWVKTEMPLEFNS